MLNIQTENNGDKYGDNETFEAFFDTYFFIPIASKLVDPLYYANLTPNMVTIISTILTLSTIYFLEIGNKYLAILVYMAGYLLDCVDGRMARKYKMGSDLGMALDSSSDTVSNTILLTYIIISKKDDLGKYSGVVLGIALLSSFLLGISFGLNEAIASHEATGSDNFYERRVKQLENKATTWYEEDLYNLFIYINDVSYKSYKSLISEYNRDNCYDYLKILKHFGPGNYCILISLLIFIIY